ncbi:hypothetical protein [Sutcliffiella halmapala]|uniref:hypothetical protein n=1 Tax=Sutcliffiella halmapala TaxID=79882 RepID=UPI000995C3F6|nr:hypothetical protein [Sutcliffiella halmapala]
MVLRKLIQEAIEYIWNNNIKDDLDKRMISNEDTLKCAFYKHLRERLSDEFLLENNLRIVTELPLSNFDIKNGDKHNRIDLTVVDPQQTDFLPLKYWSNKVIVMVEFKYIQARIERLNVINDFSFIKQIHKDIEKLHQLTQLEKYNNTLMVGAFVHEMDYGSDKISFAEDYLHHLNSSPSNIIELVGFLKGNDYRTVVNKFG